ncbi:MAG TPA: hypothetical protein VLM43_00925, partial [Desulfobacterales bacterium]|nr:hypothetical protein [Desulfobacterales bacterium]
MKELIMIKLGPAPGEMGEMSDDDIFLSRLKLLIIMAKAYLKNWPIGNYRKSAIIENAHYVFYHSLKLISKPAFLKNHDLQTHSDSTSGDVTAE